MQAIESVDWADEILLCWYGKEQNIPNVSLFPQVKIVKNGGELTDFSRARNAAIEQAKHEWIFFLDSDEVVEKDAEQKMVQILQSKHAAFTVRRKDVFLGKVLHWGEVGHVYIPRIFRRQTVKYERAVHEVPQITGLLSTSSITLYHSAHESISSFWQKMVGYIQIEAKVRKSKHQDIAWWQLLVWPIGKFLFNYVIRLGILDGWRGLIYAVLMSVYSFGERALLYEDKHQMKKK